MYNTPLTLYTYMSNIVSYSGSVEIFHCKPVIKLKHDMLSKCTELEIINS